MSAVAAVLGAGTAFPHAVQLGIAAKKLVLKVDGAKRRLFFKAVDRVRIFPGLDPRDFSSAILVVGSGVDGGKTGLIELDPFRWSGSRNTRRYRYRDPSGARGGVKRIVFRPGRLIVEASGQNVPWTSDGADLDAAWVLFRLEQEFYCARLTGRTKGKRGFRAGKAGAPADCPAALCGNAVVEPGEACDDGNLDDADGCTTACR